MEDCLYIETANAPGLIHCKASVKPPSDRASQLAYELPPGLRARMGFLPRKQELNWRMSRDYFRLVGRYWPTPELKPQGKPGAFSCILRLHQARASRYFTASRNCRPFFSIT
jgi:hypothetical protein